ncbi:MAG: hypothetical protein HY678_07975, partial [Chloroflexi bacterium]|nr:hypothetical protein [Chloroflexota bacterium]
MLGRLACATVAILAIVLTACADEATPSPDEHEPGTSVTSTPVAQSQPTTPAPGLPPFEYLDQLVELADIAVIGRIEAVSPLKELAGEGGDKVWYQDSTAIVERAIFGPQLETLTIRNALYSGPDISLRMPTRAPTFQTGERALVFLTSRSGFLDLSGPVYETAGGGVLWGKFAVLDGMITGRSPATVPRSLEEVAAWVRKDRDALAVPGSVSGIVNGLDRGDQVALRLMRLTTDRHVIRAEILESWAQGNGPWERSGLRLRAGEYAVGPDNAPGYLPVTRQHRFQVRNEGYSWAYRGLDIEMFRPEQTLERFGEPLCDAPSLFSPESPPTIAPVPPGLPQPGSGSCYGGYLGERVHIPRGMSGHVALPAGVTATVRIQRLAMDPLLVYDGGPMPDGPYPPELAEVDNPQSVSTVPTVYELRVDDGRWGLVDPLLGGHPYLVTIKADDHKRYELRPPGYQVVVFGGKVPHLVRDVNFIVSAPEPFPSATQAPAATPDLT